MKHFDLIAIIAILSSCSDCDQDIAVSSKSDVKEAQKIRLESNSNSHRYKFEVPVSSYKTLQARPSEEVWTHSLVKNLGHQGGVHVFMLTNISIFDNGNRKEGYVYQNTKQPNRYLILAERKVIVDFNLKEVGTMGVGGISVHPHPDGNMIIVLAPYKGNNILGVNMKDTEKTGQPEPIFRVNKVFWTY